MPIRCLSIDDEPHARQGVKLALAPYKDFQLVDQFGSVDEVLNADISDIDIIFLDIEMPRKSGFAILNEWQGPLPLIVFVTAYDQYAIKAFEQQALDYVLKPIDENRFADVIDRARKHVLQNNESANTESLLKTIETLKEQISKTAKSISVKTDDGYVRLKVSQIIYIESVGDHVCIHVQDRQLITRQTLKYYIAELSEFGFYQVHKSYLANAQHVKQAIKLRFSDYKLVLSNGKNIRLSRRYNSVLSQLIA
ncbi:response regulator transcription factor [Thalassomonas viridans]|uniref:Response regulator transcription factor n=1 Tax=Thalassomonas viridans TaxID=137584 RepID=A0AAF0CAF5_9GAMM|nr:LytTR family DNA-binding domain-containing protein [Thalassomonas viridans]WDE08517.1 response regulator transcription factor [Thalassomonas viridans]